MSLQSVKFKAYEFFFCFVFLRSACVCKVAKPFAGPFHSYNYSKFCGKRAGKRWGWEIILNVASENLKY